MSRRYCLALDLKDDRRLIEEYEAHHRNVWPEVLDSIRRSGILSMDIYRLHTRLLMVLEVADGFSFGAKAAADEANPVVQAWEALMWTYQQAVPGGEPGAKWQVMERIFGFAAPRPLERDGAPSA
jgi:L-rhamnose mutarotase